MVCDEKTDPARVGGEADGLRWEWATGTGSLVAWAGEGLRVGERSYDFELQVRLIGNDKYGASLHIGVDEIVDDSKIFPTCLEAQRRAEALAAELGRALIGASA